MKVLLLFLLTSVLSLYAQGGCPCNNYDPSWYGVRGTTECSSYDPTCVDIDPLWPNWLGVFWTCYQYVGNGVIDCEITTCTWLSCDPIGATTQWWRPGYLAFNATIRTPVLMSRRHQPTLSVSKTIQVKNKFWWKRAKI